MMRTLREVILGRHQAAQPKLDVIREKVVAGLERDTSVGAILCTKEMDTVGVTQTSESAVSRVSKPAGRWAALPTWKSAIRQVWKPALRGEGASVVPTDWRQFLWSLRWHLAGMSAAWVVAVLLSIDRTPGPVQAAENRSSTSPQQLLAALRENQRQVRELIAAPDSESTPQPPNVNPSPHSQNRLNSTREV